MNNQDTAYYKPKNKKERDARRRVWERYEAMRDDTLRKEEEGHWDRSDKLFMQWMPPREEGDWRPHITLPDGFSAVQTHMQETIDRRSRPYLESVETSDMALEMFNNAIFTYSMDRTGYDYQTYLARQAAAIRGTAFTMERYRIDKRKIHDPVGVNDDGTLKYQEKEVIDFDDTYTEFVENEYIFIDPSARHIDYARDMVEREVLDHAEFQRVYGFKSDFMNVDKVPKAGSISDQVAFFKRPHDMTDNDVEILHYYNRATDSYDVVANNVLIRMGYIPFKHKELPVAVHVHYAVPGRFWGMGIPRVIYSLTEERKSLRNLNLERQNMHINKMFLVNDLIDIDEEEARTRPHGFIHVNTNGLPINQAITPLEYGDVPVSYYKTEEMLLEDIRRAHGIDDRMQGVDQGGTATEAAILKEAAQRRINLINTLSEMDTVVRIGRLKWSNIQFFYKAPRVERIMEDNEDREKKIYRRIKVQGKEFTITQENGQNRLIMNETDGTSSFKLDKTMASFMNGDFDVIVKGGSSPVLSKPLQQAKITEMFGLIALNPQLTATIDPDKAVRRYLEINDEDPKVWMRGSGITPEQMKRLAIHENLVMAAGQPLAPTQGATEEHTEEHLNFTNTVMFEQLPEQVQNIFMEHIMGEHEANPNTGSVADLLGGGGGGTPPGPQGGMPAPQSVADLQPSTVGGANRQDEAQDQAAA